MSENTNKHKSHEEREKTRALLASIYKKPMALKEAEAHLDELKQLTETLGIEVLATLPLAVREYNASTFMSSGKLEELKNGAVACGADCVIIDEEISPSQQRNLEKELGLTVMDRTEVIIEVFTKRAKTKEATLQVELAKLNYLAPRLKRLWTHLSRQAGTVGGGGSGGGYLKGVGEKQIELDRRQIARRITHLKEELAEVRKTREIKRQERERKEVPIFAIVGYTNAGKSTLLRELTDADVLVEDKLFATLDTTSRKFRMKNNQEVVLIDTVGFIRKLPHQLVEAFKGTLEEALFADILIHVVDVCDQAAIDHVETTLKVLKELGADKKPMITILNKVDALEDPGQLLKLKLKCPKTVELSAVKREGFDELFERMLEELNHLREKVELKIPQAEYHLINSIARLGHIIKQEYEDNDIYLIAEVPPALLGRLRCYLVQENHSEEEIL